MTSQDPQKRLPIIRATLNRRMNILIREGFTPEEAFDLANWKAGISHWTVRGLRRDRRALLANLRGQDLSEEEITAVLERRYVDLGIRGQFEQEDWYFNRVGAA